MLCKAPYSECCAPPLRGSSRGCPPSPCFCAPAAQAAAAAASSSSEQSGFKGGSDSGRGLRMRARLLSQPGRSSGVQQLAPETTAHAPLLHTPPPCKPGSDMPLVEFPLVVTSRVVGIFLPGVA
eukprot:scaffold10117_cov16-Tisochrysis_lutea.AAC.1